jgi:hypothetical protein
MADSRKGGSRAFTMTPKPKERLGAPFFDAAKSPGPEYNTVDTFGKPQFVSRRRAHTGVSFGTSTRSGASKLFTL